MRSIRSVRSLIPALILGSLAALSAAPHPTDSAGAGTPQRNAAGDGASTVSEGLGHALLERLAGDWNARVKSKGDDGKFRKWKAVEIGRICCGGQFLRIEFNGKAKKTVKGNRTILGFNLALDRFILTRADLNHGSLAWGRGAYDPKSDTLTMQVEVPDGDGGVRAVREVIAWDGPDRRTLTVSTIDPDGAESVVMSVRYKRR